MLRLIKFFQGFLYVRVSGYSPERFLNLCAKLNILMWNVKYEDGGYTLFMSKRAYALTDSVRDKTGVHLEIIKESGVPHLAYRYRRHLFFVIGIGAAAFLILLMSAFIWKVEISGNMYYSDQVIYEYLEANDAGYASRKSGINCKDLQDALRKEFEDITWVSAKIEGTRLYIEIQERIKGEAAFANEDTQMEQPTDLIASADGIVESITTRQGTPFVMAGDEVKPGDVLVSGVVEIMSDYGEVASRKYVSSDADVILRTVIPYEDSFSKKYQEKELTGKKRTTYVFNIKNVFYSIRSQSDDSSMIQTEDMIPIILGEDFYLPFQIIRKRWYEVALRSKEYTKQEIEDLVEEHYQKYNEKLRENGVQIIGKSVMIDDSGKIVHVTGELTVLVTQKNYRVIEPHMQTQEGNGPDGIDTADD